MKRNLDASTRKFYLRKCVAVQRVKTTVIQYLNCSYFSAVNCGFTVFSSKISYCLLNHTEYIPFCEHLAYFLEETLIIAISNLSVLNLLNSRSETHR